MKKFNFEKLEMYNRSQSLLVATVLDKLKALGEMRGYRAEGLGFVLIGSDPLFRRTDFAEKACEQCDFFEMTRLFLKSGVGMAWIISVYNSKETELSFSPELITNSVGDLVMQFILDHSETYNAMEGDDVLIAAELERIEDEIQLFLEKVDEQGADLVELVKDKYEI